MLACRSSFYQPCLWSYRILDKEAGLYEVVQNSRTPKVHVLVTIGPEAQISCTCRSGREGFRRTQRGCCIHAYALITLAAQYRGVGRTYSYGYVYASGNGFSVA